MQKFTVFLVLIAFAITSHGQNLIPNGDFEEFIECPDDMSQFDRVVYWFQPTGGTPDYFNACDPTNFVSVPSNFNGFQEAQSGSAYAGIFAGADGGPLYREYVEVDMNTNLLPGYPYLFEMYVCLSDSSSCWPEMICTYISHEKIFDPLTTGIITQYSYLDHTLCSTAGDFISNTTVWKKINFCFVADGSEKYVTIGNSFSDSYAPCYNETGGYHTAYLFVDNVSLTPLPVLTAKFDTTVCKGVNPEIDISGLLDEPDNSEPLFVWNDGFVGAVRTLYHDGNYEVYINNGCGTDSIYVTMQYDYTCPEIFIIPNAFSPNGDGLNDRFRIQAENITVQDFRIYNRWGGLVFQSNDAVNGWDGRVNDQLQPIGVYLYILDYTTNISEQAIRKSGYITLIY